MLFIKYMNLLEATSTLVNLDNSLEKIRFYFQKDKTFDLKVNSELTRLVNTSTNTHKSQHFSN